MKKKINIGIPVLIILFLISVNCSSQTEYTENQLKETAKKVIDNSLSCTLITVDEDGAPRARAMDGFPVEDDFTIWFGTKSNTRKVDQIKNDPRVTLYYLSQDNSGYVVISGKAELVDDPEMKEKYWKKEWEQFYSEKEKDYLLIKVTPIWLEVLSPPHGINNNPDTWKPPVIEF